MPHLERIYYQPPTAWGRFTQALRSYTLGPLTLKDPEIARKLGWGGGPVASGIPVSETTALTYAAVWQAVTLIAGDVGSLPLIFYKRDKQGGKTRYTDHPLYYLLHDAPNPEMSAMVWRETQQAHLLTWGNAYAEIERDAAGRPVGLWPLPPPRVTPYRENGRLRYRVAGESGRDVILDARDMLHIPGLGFDGLVGYSVIHQARESLGLLAAAEKFGATFFGNGTTFGGALKHPKTLSAKAQETLRSSIEGGHKGADKAHRFLILEEGMDFTRFGVDPNDAQFLETRQFQIAEVARWFNLPLHKLREMEHSSVRANIEQEALDYYVSTLRPWLTRWEHELRRKLISPLERNIQHIEFLLEGVLRGDQQSRFNAYAVGRQWGWLSQNEIRALENMNPIDGGDTYLSPMNMVPSARLDEIIDKQVEPTPAPVAPAPPSQDGGDDDDSRAALTEALARIEAQAVTVGTLQARCDTLTVDLATAETTGATLATTVEQLRADLAAGQASLTTVTAERDALIRDTAAQIDAMSTTVEATEAACDTLRTERDALAGTLAGARAEIETSAVKALEADARHAASEAAWGDRLNALALEVAEASRAAQAAVEGQNSAEQRAIAAEAQLAAAVLAVAEAASAQQTAERLAADAASTAAEAGAARAQQAERHAGHLAGIVAAYRAVMADTVSRLIHRETDRARSKRATPVKLAGWAESYYELHEVEHWVAVLGPVVGVHQAVTCDARPAEDVARQIVQAHFDESKRQLLAAVAAEDYDQAVTTTLARWEATRAAAVADAFMRQEIAHVREIQ